MASTARPALSRRELRKQNERRGAVVKFPPWGGSSAWGFRGVWSTLLN